AGGRRPGHRALRRRPVRLLLLLLAQRGPADRPRAGDLRRALHVDHPPLSPRTPGARPLRRPAVIVPVPMPTDRKVAVAGGLVAAVVCYCSAAALMKSYGPAMFCTPFFVGAIVGLFAIDRPIRAALQTLLLALLLAIVTLREGVVCCLMALPFLTPMTILGAICTSIVRRYVRGRRARAGLGALLVVAAIGWQAVEGAVDDPAHHPIHVARSSIVIPASPERVFATLATRDLAVRADWPWFLRIGLPMPGHVTYDAPEAGGRV